MLLHHSPPEQYIRGGDLTEPHSVPVENVPCRLLQKSLNMRRR